MDDGEFAIIYEFGTQRVEGMFHSLQSLLETERGHAQLGTGTTFTNDREFPFCMRMVGTLIPTFG